MKLEIKAPWHEHEDFAKQDRKFLMHLFQLNHSNGTESVKLTDHREYRATADIETEDYNIHGKQS